MITIYCLLHPVTNIPFYIGATKSALNIRLMQHVNAAKKQHKDWDGCHDDILRQFPHKRKNVFIKNIINVNNKKPIIKPLLQCNKNMADYYEKLAFNSLILTSYGIYQETKRFHYTKSCIR